MSTVRQCYYLVPYSEPIAINRAQFQTLGWANFSTGKQHLLTLESQAPETSRSLAVLTTIRTMYSLRK